MEFLFNSQLLYIGFTYFCYIVFKLIDNNYSLMPLAVVCSSDGAIIREAKTCGELT